MNNNDERINQLQNAVDQLREQQSQDQLQNLQQDQIRLNQLQNLQKEQIRLNQLQNVEREKHINLLKQFQDQQQFISNLQQQIEKLQENRKNQQIRQETQQNQQIRQETRRNQLDHSVLLKATDFLTIIDRVRLEKTCKFVRKKMTKSKYWKCIDINFDESQLFTHNAVFIWKLLCTRKAALKTVVITFGSREEAMIKSLLVRCDCSDLQKLLLYSNVHGRDYHLLLGAAYTDNICDVTVSYYINAAKLDDSIMSKIDTSYEASNDRPIYYSLMQSSGLQELRIVCADSIQADMIQYFKALKRLTVVVSCKKSDYLQILIRVLESVELLPSLESFEFRSVGFFDDVTSRSLVIKSNTLKSLKVKLAKATIIYDVQCPSLQKIEIDDRIYGNAYEYPLFIGRLNHSIGETEGDDEKLSTNWNFTEENQESNEVCKFIGIHIEAETKQCYINYVRLPQGCIFNMYN